MLVCLVEQHRQQSSAGLDTCDIAVQYIYISTEEMKAVAEYIKRRGRIAIGELAAKSNTFIDLEAKATAVSLRPAPCCNLPVSSTMACYSMFHCKLM